MEYQNQMLEYRLYLASSISVQILIILIPNKLCKGFYCDCVNLNMTKTELLIFLPSSQSYTIQPVEQARNQVFCPLSLPHHFYPVYHKALTVLTSHGLLNPFTFLPPSPHPLSHQSQPYHLLEALAELPDIHLHTQDGLWEMQIPSLDTPANKFSGFFHSKGTGKILNMDLKAHSLFLLSHSVLALASVQVSCPWYSLCSPLPPGLCICCFLCPGTVPASFPPKGLLLGLQIFV